MLASVLDHFAPVRRVKVKVEEDLHGISNWCDAEAQQAIAQRDEAYKVWHGNINRVRGDGLWSAYLEKRRVASNLSNFKHNRFVSGKLDPQLPSKKLFQNLRSLGLIKESNPAVTNMDVNRMNDFFLKKVNRNSDIDFAIPRATNVPEFSFAQVTEVEVYNSILAIKSNAAGLDEVPLSFIKLILPIILSSLTHIFNHIFTCCTFPDRWKTSVVLPVPKVSSPTVFSEFRPISLLPCLSKSFENLMAQQMERHVNDHSLVTVFQSGFRKHHSTTTAILKITEDLRSNLEEGQATVLVLLDFSQAFDTVVHKLLTCKLSNEHNYSTESERLLDSYLSGRRQMVRFSGRDSDVGRVTCGVPQGSVLGPKLFSYYINSVSSVIINCAFHIYADDLQLYKSCNVENFQQCIDDVNSDLARVHAWAKSNGLLLNPKKSQVIVIYGGKKELPTPSLSIGPNSIKVVPKVVNLGFTINETLSPSDHIAKVCQKVYWTLRSLRPHASRTPFEVRRRLILSLIMPHISYGGVVYCSPDAASIEKLERAFRACIRYLHRLKRRDSVEGLGSSITGVDFHVYLKMRLLLFLHKVIHVRHPSYIFSMIHFSSSQRTRGLVPPVHRRLAMDRSFSVKAVEAWNSLPHSLKSLESRNAFLLALKRHFASTL